MTFVDAAKKVESCIKELEKLDVQSKEYDDKLEELTQLRNFANDEARKQGDENTMVLATATQMYWVNRINLNMMVSIQGKFNRYVRTQLKEMGADVTKLDEYLEKNVKMYFPNPNE